MCIIVVCYAQLVDDLLDFVSSENIMGKPAAADLKLGLATAPVLFAAHQVSADCLPDDDACRWMAIAFELMIIDLGKQVSKM